MRDEGNMVAQRKMCNFVRDTAPGTNLFGHITECTHRGMSYHMNQYVFYKSHATKRGLSSS